MKLPKFSKKLVAIGAAAGIAMGAAGIAAAYLTTTTTGSGSATVTNASGLRITNVGLASGNVLSPNTSNINLNGTIQNNNKGNVKLTGLTATITGTNTTGVCTVDWFYFGDGTGQWKTPAETDLGSSGDRVAVLSGSNTTVVAPTVTIAPGDYFSSEIPLSGTSASATNALFGLKLGEITATATQGGCTSVTITLKAS